MTRRHQGRRSARSAVALGRGGGRRRRFTLIEVVVAVTLMALVATLLVGFGREMSRTWQKLQDEHARFRELLALDRALDSLLANAVPFLWPNEEGDEVSFFVGESDFLRLASLHAVTQPEEGALRFTELFVEDECLLAAYRQRPYLDDLAGAVEPRVSVLARGVDHVELSYADWEGDDQGDWSGRLTWVDEWDPERLEMPLAVQVTVVWRDGRVESWLRRTAAAYRERWGKWESAKDNE